ncbi:MAG: GNAT family N-acetyltransferase [Candidatus Dependentiae bacterium]|nr:GNAT family N-acetyltransferase [Candidatus Dependentiae bacterium]
MKNKIRLLIALAISIGLGAVVSGLIYKNYTHIQEEKDIYPYDAARDEADIHQLIKNNWYWLIATPDYYFKDKIDFILHNMAPSMYEPRYFGKLQINVMRKDSNFIGFVAYYKKSFYVGQVLFLAVDEKYRGKRYAQILLDSALENLKNDGCQLARLPTRTTNFKAQSVYKRAGFTEYDRDEGYVYYEKKLV